MQFLKVEFVSIHFMYLREKFNDEVKLVWK